MYTKLGSGSYGNVYECSLETPQCQGSMWAIKQLKPLDCLFYFHHNLLRELWSCNGMEISNARKHGIPQRAMCLRDETSFYIVMECCQTNAFDMLMENFSLGTFLSLWIPVFKAVHLLHSHGVAHRDIKLQNILFRGDEQRGLLTDFGMSLMKEGSSKSLNKCTITTRAPEIVWGKQHALEADMWSLAVCIKSCMERRPIGSLGNIGVGVDWKEDTTEQQQATLAKTRKRMRDHVTGYFDEFQNKSDGTLTLQQWARTTLLQTDSDTIITFALVYVLKKLMRLDSRERMSIDSLRNSCLVKVMPHTCPILLRTRPPKSSATNIVHVQQKLTLERFTPFPPATEAVCKEDIQFICTILHACNMLSYKNVFNSLDIYSKIASKEAEQMVDKEFKSLLSKPVPIPQSVPKRDLYCVSVYTGIIMCNDSEHINLHQLTRLCYTFLKNSEDMEPIYVVKQHHLEECFYRVLVSIADIQDSVWTRITQANWHKDSTTMNGILEQLPTSWSIPKNPQAREHVSWLPHAISL